jgi:hypothetical protein
MPRVRTKKKLHFARMESGGTLSRFKIKPTTEPVPLDQASLPDQHRAVIEGRTLFPTRVFNASERPRILMRGFHNSKIGDRITKGPWSGMKIFTLSLEERATCPRSCAVWSACYGNGLPVAVRFRYNDEFLALLEEELVAKGDEHPDGFAVRAHVLGDFPTLDYVAHWSLWLAMIPQMHVWGYTAHPAASEIGSAVRAMNGLYPSRWAFRQSVAPGEPLDDWQAATAWEKPEMVNRNQYRAIGGVVCPVEVGASAACGTCGLCWAPAAANTRIVFLGHGTRPGAAQRHTKTEAKYANPIPKARNTVPPERFTDAEAFIAARGVTRLPPAKARGL